MKREVPENERQIIILIFLSPNKWDYIYMYKSSNYAIKSVLEG